MHYLLLLTIALINFQIHTQVCPQSYFFNGQRCAPCKINCQCSSVNGCDSCLPGYTYDALFQNCLACPAYVDSVNVGCRECCYQVQGPAFVCSTCPAGNYVFMVGGQCIQLTGCSSIATSGICLNCANGYYLNQGACLSCDASCATCLDSSLCLTCSAGYFNASNINYALCSACSIGCTTCTSATSCSACTTGYRLSASTCIGCVANCLSCSGGTCTSCNSVSGLISTTCYLCTDTSQQGSIGCISCSSDGARIICTACSSGYYLNPTTQVCATCASLFPNSAVCNSTNVIQCNNDYAAILNTRYYLVSNQCVSNTKNCMDMLDTSGDCSTCYFTSVAYYGLFSTTCQLCSTTGCLTYSSTCQCLSCQNGYQFINNQCIACQNLHCYVCQASVQACQQCAPSYGRFSTACIICSPANCYNCDGDYTNCAVCNTGYYLSNGQCYQCQTNCLSCLSNTQCTSCAADTFLQANGRCVILPSNCLQIDNTTISSNVGSCKRCSYGYILMEGNCYPCSSTLFNLDVCNSYHCPNYYAQLASYDSHILVSLLLALLLFIII